MDEHKDTTDDSKSPAIQDIEQRDIGAIDSVAEIEVMQKALSSNYKTLAKEFSKSRLSRVEAYISKIEEVQLQLQRNKQLYAGLVEQGVPALDTHSGTERSATKETKGSKRKRFDSSAGIADPRPSSPPPERPASPPLGPVPVFTEPFEEILKPYRQNLEAIKRKYDLQSDLIETQTERNAGLAWRQSIRDRQEAREKLRKDVASELLRMEMGYKSMMKHEDLLIDKNRYRAAARKVGERKTKSDMVSIAEEVKHRTDEAQATAIVDAHSMYQKRTPLTAASESEIDRDLMIIRTGNPAAVRVDKVEANYMYMEQPAKRQSYGPTTMTDLVNDEIELNGVVGLQYHIPQAPDPTVPHAHYGGYQSYPPSGYGQQPLHQGYSMPPPQGGPSLPPTGSFRN